jgi:hypothetical protein
MTETLNNGTFSKDEIFKEVIKGPVAILGVLISKNINSEDFEPVVKELFDSLILMLKLHMAVEDEISEAKNDYRKQIRKIIEKAKITDPEFDQTINRWNEES